MKNKSKVILWSFLGGLFFLFTATASILVATNSKRKSFQALLNQRNNLPTTLSENINKNQLSYADFQKIISGFKLKPEFTNLKAQTVYTLMKEPGYSFNVLDIIDTGNKLNLAFEIKLNNSTDENTRTQVENNTIKNLIVLAYKDTSPFVSNQNSNSSTHSPDFIYQTNFNLTGFKDVSSSKTNQDASKLSPLDANINSEFKDENTKKENKILDFDISFINSYFRVEKNYSKLLPSDFLNKLEQTYKTEKDNNDTSSFGLITKLGKFKLSNSLLDPIVLKPNQKLFFSSTSLQRKSYLANDENGTLLLEFNLEQDKRIINTIFLEVKGLNSIKNLAKDIQQQLTTFPSLFYNKFNINKVTDSKIKEILKNKLEAKQQSGSSQEFKYDRKYIAPSEIIKTQQDLNNFLQWNYAEIKKLSSVYDIQFDAILNDPLTDSDKNLLNYEGKVHAQLNVLFKRKSDNVSYLENIKDVYFKLFDNQFDRDLKLEYDAKLAQWHNSSNVFSIKPEKKNLLISDILRDLNSVIPSYIKNKSSRNRPDNDSQFYSYSFEELLALSDYTKTKIVISFLEQYFNDLLLDDHLNSESKKPGTIIADLIKLASNNKLNPLPSTFSKTNVVFQLYYDNQRQALIIKFVMSPDTDGLDNEARSREIIIKGFAQSELIDQIKNDYSPLIFLNSSKADTSHLVSTNEVKNKISSLSDIMSNSDAKLYEITQLSSVNTDVVHYSNIDSNKKSYYLNSNNLSGIILKDTGLKTDSIKNDSDENIQEGTTIKNGTIFLTFNFLEAINDNEKHYILSSLKNSKLGEVALFIQKLSKDKASSFTNEDSFILGIEYKNVPIKSTTASTTNNEQKVNQTILAAISSEKKAEVTPVKLDDNSSNSKTSVDKNHLNISILNNSQNFSKVFFANPLNTIILQINVNNTAKESTLEFILKTKANQDNIYKSIIKTDNQDATIKVLFDRGIDFAVIGSSESSKKTSMLFKSLLAFDKISKEDSEQIMNLLSSEYLK
ncbi:hypothetical protein DR092_03600 [Mycoplasma hyorhinis]|uniref:P110/LppT family adhesin N-terminal domain n=1 Tax=Mesomycoplasma hyorhinis TaxID=2100 RepID=UPI00136BDC08|nr:P110/LppT family adhesin N-terminal domain [Mesomycoplasma hyorhinis]MXR09785.1 hypothetical protein [Mesomycoplasma hyorhinis]